MYNCIISHIFRSRNGSRFNSLCQWVAFGNLSLVSRLFLRSASFFPPWANSLCFWFCGVLWYLTTNYRNCNATATTIVHDNNHRLQREAACTQSVLCHKPYCCRPGCGGCDATRPGREHGEPVRRHSRPSGPSTSPVSDCRSSNATRSRP